MALYYDLPVYKDTYQLILKIFELTKEFSREYKYTLGQDMKRDKEINYVGYQQGMLQAGRWWCVKVLSV